ncbi:hypothetical protein Mterra_02116 [Calidithermus terrae]|uniref:Uncharacterized protein n=1 Tax=Calidithermus terrae TaxID=1408545 RepID=A0A399ELS6_9DEIN|nr:hypothetical protein [Calidithermus terrae]RIH84009.1 hypothetical protein Mterra_02116 [Calidithermus terrae]
MDTPKPKRLRRRKPGDLGQLRAVLWSVLVEAESIAQNRLLDEHTRLKAVSALATAAGAYLKATEQGDLEARLSSLEAALKQPPLRKIL